MLCCFIISDRQVKDSQRFDPQAFEYPGPWSNFKLQCVRIKNAQEGLLKTLEQQYIYLKKPEVFCLPAVPLCQREGAPLIFE